MAKDDLNGRIADLETEVRILKDDKKQLRNGLDEANELVREMREHCEHANSVIEDWKHSFDMELHDDGKWYWNSSDPAVLQNYSDLIDIHNRLVRDWNRYASTFMPRNFGRPLQASESQVQDVRRLRKDGVSLRGIAKETGLTLRTVRTILDQGSDRERTRTGDNRRKPIDKVTRANINSKIRGRQYLAKRINSTLEDGAALVKAAKGLGK
jgi:hypothetical protein